MIKLLDYGGDSSPFEYDRNLWTRTISIKGGFTPEFCFAKSLRSSIRRDFIPGLRAFHKNKAFAFRKGLFLWGVAYPSVVPDSLTICWISCTHSPLLDTIPFDFLNFIFRWPHSLFFLRVETSLDCGVHGIKRSFHLHRHRSPLSFEIGWFVQALENQLHVESIISGNFKPQILASGSLNIMPRW